MIIFHCFFVVVVVVLFCFTQCKVLFTVPKLVAERTKQQNNKTKTKKNNISS